VHKKGNSLSDELELFSCAIDIPPDRKNKRLLNPEPRLKQAKADISTEVERVGTVQVSLWNLNLKTMDKKKVGHWYSTSRQTFYQLHMTLEASLGDDSGLLTFKVMCDGSQCGTAKIDFNKN